MKPTSLLIQSALMFFGAVLFHFTGQTYLFWLITVFDVVAISIKYNYATARICCYLLLIVVSLCGDTNYLLRYSIIDLIITFSIIMINGHTISIQFKSYKLLYPWIVLLAAGTIGGFFYSIDRTSYYSGIQIYALLLLVILCSILIDNYNISHGNQKMHLQTIIYIFALSNIGLVILFYISNPLPVLVSEHRALISLLGSSGIRSNTLAGIISTYLIILYFCRNQFKKITIKMIWVILLFMDIIMIIFLQSRGAYVAIGTVALIAIFDKVMIDRNISISDLVKISCLVVFITFLLVSPNIKTTIVGRIFARFINDASDISNGRFDLYIRALNMWKYHPLFGNGFLQFDAMGRMSDPHNWVLGYLDSTGVIGTVGFIIFIIIVIKPIRQVSVSNNSFRYGVIAQVIHGLFEPVLTQNFTLSFFIVICIISYLSISDNTLGLSGERFEY